MNLVLVTGTGTGIGKTTLSTALLRAWAHEGRKVLGLKPVETGGTEDGDALAAASSIAPPERAPYLLRDPISPHLAARREGITIQLDVVTAWVERARPLADVVLLELAGGLFSPLGDDLVNADLARALRPDRLLLVAPNRLGVLHDVLATTRAASGLTFDAILLNSIATPDASTDSNARELARLLGRPVDEIGLHPDLGELARRL